MRRHYNEEERFAAVVFPQPQPQPQPPAQAAGATDDSPRRHIVVIRRDGSLQALPQLSMQVRAFAEGASVIETYEEMVQSCGAVVSFGGVDNFLTNDGLTILRSKAFGNDQTPRSTPAIGREIDLAVHLGIRFTNPAVMIEACHALLIPAPMTALPGAGRKRLPASAFAEQQAAAVFIMYTLILAWRRRDETLWLRRAEELRSWLERETENRPYLQHYHDWLTEQCAAKD